VGPTPPSPTADPEPAPAPEPAPVIATASRAPARARMPSASLRMGLARAPREGAVGGGDASEAEAEEGPSTRVRSRRAAATWAGRGTEDARSVPADDARFSRSSVSRASARAPVMWEGEEGDMREEEEEEDFHGAPADTCWAPPPSIGPGHTSTIMLNVTSSASARRVAHRSAKHAPFIFFGVGGMCGLSLRVCNVTTALRHRSRQARRAERSGLRTTSARGCFRRRSPGGLRDYGFFFLAPQTFHQLHVQSLLANLIYSRCSHTTHLQPLLLANVICSRCSPTSSADAARPEKAQASTTP
jgi:hypothetical protein